MNESTLNRMIREHKEHLIWLSVFLVLAVFVTALVFGTLKRSVQAQTYTKRVFACSYAQEGAEPVAHQHNDDCYENGELICTLPERELHIHGDECYTEEKVLVCTLKEGEGHVHTDACYTEKPVLICTLEENDGHVHSVEAGCYTRVQGDLICTDEDPEHVHNDNCYAWEEVLTCEIPVGDGAHHHSEDCYETRRVLSCGKEEGEGAHTHDGTCYEMQKVLICDKEEITREHVHTVDCFQVVDMSPEEIHALHLSELPESDPDADVESPDVWESRFASVPLSGEWDRDLLKIAETQLGYTESQRNFDAVLDENGEGYTLKGWTRYGAWYGIPYGDWCAMFISFCLNYADIPESAIPYDCATTTWIDSLSARDMYAPAGTYDPKPGDLIFFDWEGDGLSDHVGIVWAVNPESITTIEGNHTTSVELFDYSPSDSHIQGYGILPENPELAAAATQDTEPADDASTGTDVENVENNNEETDADVTGDAVDAADSDAVNAADAAGTTAEGSANAEPAVNMPPFSYSERVAGMRVSIDADEGAFPEGTTVKITAIEDDGIAEQVAPAVSGQVVKVQAVDITFYDADGNEIEPQIPIRVTMRPFIETEADNVGVVHVSNDGVVSAVETQNDVPQPDQGIAFSADSFSTYALVYTVTFAYDGEGNVYQYSMPGGTGLSLRELLIDLGMKTEDNVDSYLSHVVSVAFSKPDCMTVTKEGNDWLLKSVHAFDTTESLAVTFDDFSMLAIPVSVSGIEELQLENAVISSSDGVFLPEGTEGYANVVEDAAETISAVEDYVEKNTPEPTFLQQLFSSGSKDDENKDGGDKAYQVFDIGLDNIDTDSFKDGFNVEVKLPENVVGKDFHLYHIHDNSVEEIDLTLASTKMETGADLVTGFSFQTDSFSEFVLSYTVDFEYTDENGNVKTWSFPGRGSYPVTDVLEKIGVTGNVEDVNIVLTEAVDETDEKAFYTEKKEDGWYLVSEVAFDDIYELTIKIDGKKIKIIVTDAENEIPLNVKLNFIDDPFVVSENDNYYLLLDAYIQIDEWNSVHAYNIVKIISDGESKSINLDPVNISTWCYNGGWSHFFLVDGKWYNDSNQEFPYDNGCMSAKIIKAKYDSDNLMIPQNYTDNNKYNTVVFLNEHYCYNVKISPLNEVEGYSATVNIADTAKLYDAIGPTDFLGGSAEYGIVANKLIQTAGHSETNFAVNYYSATKESDIDIDGGGNGDIPLYVGHIKTEATDFELRIGFRTTGMVDIFAPSIYHNNSDYVKIDKIESRQYPVNFIKCEASDVERYVSGLISEGSTISKGYAQQDNAVTPEVANKSLDFTNYPDGKTIVVNCNHEIVDAINTGGWAITKLPNQSIVFNIPGNQVNIKEFYVDDGTTPDRIKSNTYMITNGQHSDHDLDVERVILKHIFFNAYEATSVDINTAAGAFLCPEATSVTQINGAGWILAKGTVTSNAEWHYFYQERTYYSATGATLKLKKYFKNKESDQNVIEFSATGIDKSFSFQLEETDESWNIKANGIKSTATTDSNGVITFSGDPFKFSTTTQIDSQKRYFIISECHPDDATVITNNGKTYYYKDGIVYSNEKLKFSVVATFNNNVASCKFYLNGDEENVANEFGSEGNVFEYYNPTFINLLSNGEASIEGNKEFKNISDPLPQDKINTIIDTYQFTLTDNDSLHNNPMPNPNPPEKLKQTNGKFVFDFGSIKYSLTDLDKDLDGNPVPTTFEYKITESGTVSGVTNDSRDHIVKVTVSLATNKVELNTVVTYFIDLNNDHDVEDVGENVTQAKFIFENSFPEEDSFVFEKRWTVIGGTVLEWPENQSITVTLTRKHDNGSNEQSAWYTLTKDSSGDINPSSSTSESFRPVLKRSEGTGSNEYKYAINGLDAKWTDGATTGTWKYTLSEQNIDGYNTYYFKSEDEPQDRDKDYIDSEGIIKNELVTYELPETGGTGTELYILLGGLMVVTAGAVLMLRKKKNKA